MSKADLMWNRAPDSTEIFLTLCNEVQFYMLVKKLGIKIL